MSVLFVDRPENKNSLVRTDELARKPPSRSRFALSMAISMATSANRSQLSSLSRHEAVPSSSCRHGTCTKSETFIGWRQEGEDERAEVVSFCSSARAALKDMNTIEKQLQTTNLARNWLFLQQWRRAIVKPCS